MHSEPDATSPSLPQAFPGAHGHFLLLLALLQVAWCYLGWEAGGPSSARAGWWTPVLFAYLAPLPHLPSTAHSFLTPQGLDEAHSTPSLMGRLRSSLSDLSPHQTQGDGLRGGSGAPARSLGTDVLSCPRDGM